MLAFVIGFSIIIFCFGCFLIGKHLQKKYNKNKSTSDDNNSDDD